MKRFKGLYFILPEFKKVQNYINLLKKIIKYEPVAVQLRIKNKTDKFFYEVAYKLAKFLKMKKIYFIINDRVDIALAVDADGVHLGQEDLPVLKVKELIRKFNKENFIIGYSTHSVKQVKYALELPIDYLSIGPIFKTTTKPEYKVVGVDIIKKVKKILKNKIPIVAIGGINHKNIHLLKNANPDVIAMSSILEKPDLSAIEIIKKFTNGNISQ